MSGFVRLNKKVGAKATPSSTPTPTTAPTPPPFHGTGSSLTQPVQLNAEAKSQQKILQKVAAASQIRIPNGCKPWVASQFLTSSGIKDIDSLLSGGIPLNTLNTIVTDVRTRHGEVFEKVFLWEGHLRKQRCVHISNRTNQSALYFAQQVLKPALATNNVPQTKKNDENIENEPKRASKLSSIDDDEISIITKRQKAPQTPENEPKERKITQGSVVSALNNEKASKSLTIAWQYDKYSNKTMDDSNLSGVNDDELDNEHNDLEKNEDVAHPESVENANIDINIVNTKISEYRDQFDYHIITPHTTINPTITAHHSTPLRNLLLQTNELVCNFPIAQCHLNDPLSATNNLSDGKINLIIPNRVVLELTTDLIFPQPRDTKISQVDSLLSNFFSSEPQSDIITAQSPEVQDDITIVQFLYAIYSIAASLKNTVITIFAPPSALPVPILTLLTNLSQFMCSFVSFQSQTSLSGLTGANSTQISSAAMLFGDKHDGLFTIHKFPRVNTPSYSFKLPDSTLFLFRLKKQLTATLISTSTTTVQNIGITKLVLPPEISRSGNAHIGVSGNTNKDLFAEAVQNISQQGISNLNDSEMKIEAKETQIVNKGGSCPTCGNSNINAPNNNQSMFGAIGSLKSKQQEQLQAKQNDMVILEEEENEDELE